MGGQACVFYGAAEFSRDSDFAILADAENLDRLRGALTELRAGVIAVPPFDVAYLEKGHAVHFRCRHPECDGLRVDVMSVMRGVDPFELIWQRRATIELPDGTVCDLLSIADLVRAKKDAAGQGLADDPPSFGIRFLQQPGPAARSCKSAVLAEGTAYA